MRGVSKTIACLFVIYSSSSDAAWLSTDSSAIEEAGISDGMASYCKLNTTEILSLAGLYIGVHTSTDAEAEKAGQLYKTSKDNGYSTMKEGGSKISCLDVGRRMEKSVEYLKGSIDRTKAYRANSVEVVRKMLQK